METNELINILTQAPPVRRPPRFGVVAAVATGLSGLVTIILLGLRPELSAGHPPVSFWMKTLLLALAALASFVELNRASKPLAAQRKPWLMIALAVLVVSCVAGEWMTLDARHILGGFLTSNFPACLIAVTVYGGIAMVGFTLLMKRYAPANAKLCASLIGFASASAAAVGYSIHCPLDSPTFIAVAYGLPMAGLSIAGRAFLPRYLVW